MPLEGERVILREERPEDMVLLTALRNDLETQAWPLSLPPDYTELMVRRRYEKREFSFDRQDGRFIIEDKESGEPAGTISYTFSEPRWTTTIGIVLDKKFWGKGTAYDAQEVLLKFLFHETGLRVVRLYTHSGNPHAVKLAEKSGFRISARQREAVFKGGQLFDSLIMDILREEYYQLHPELEDGLAEGDLTTRE